jgi:polysaccharide export outer membrane protein
MIKKMNKGVLIACFGTLLLLVSCVSRKKIVYMQNEVNASTLPYAPVLQPDDVLVVVVSADNPEVALPFNLTQPGVSAMEPVSYLVDSNGAIVLPVIGKFTVAGMTTLQATSRIKESLSKYIQNPIVNLRLKNFKVSVLGEVNRPGLLAISSERLTLLEALSQAGDLSVYGNRKNVKIIRETNGVRIVSTIDLTQSDFMNSPYYFLQQNDVVYVEPNKTKINSSMVGPNISVIFASISLLLTIFAIFF